MDRNECLKQAKTIINGARAKSYGSAKDNFIRVAKLWSVILGQEITPTQAILCMDAIKTSRLIENPTHADSWVDKAGYNALGAEISGA